MTSKEMRDAIVAARRQANLTQEQVCERLGIGRATYTRWESGKYILSIDVLNKIADLYDCVFEGTFKPKKQEVNKF